MSLDKILTNFQYVERFFRLILVAILVVEIAEMLFTMHGQTAVMNNQTETIGRLTEVIKTLPCVK